MLRKYPVFFLLLALVAGYFGYKWLSSRPPEVWKYIPASASVIISSDKLQQTFDPVSDSLPAKYRDLPFVSLASGSLSLIKWFNQAPDQINTFLKGKTITYAFHPLAGNRLGIVIYLPVNSELEKKWLGNPKTGSLRVSTHNFQGHSVTDISNEKSESLFSYLLKDDFLIISQNGELIEDVIRNAKSGNATADKSERFHPLPEGVHELSIYTNDQTWRDYTFPKRPDANVSAFLDLLPENYGIHLSPSVSPAHLTFRSENEKKGEHPISRLISGQKGTIFENTSHISQQTTHLIRLSVADKGKFKSAFKKWQRDRNSHPAITTFNKMLGKEKDTFYQQIGPEVMLCINESVGGLSDNKVMLIQFEDFEKAKTVLGQVTEKAETTDNQAPIAFQGYEIFPVQIPDLTEGLFGPLFGGFRESHITFIAPYLIIGNNAQSVRNYLIDYENQLTWSHSPSLDSLDLYYQDNAQLSLISNMSKVRAQSERNRTSLKNSLDQMATTTLSYREDGNDAEFEFRINYADAGRASGQIKLNADFEWNDALPPFFSAMLNPLDGTSEILITNRSHQLIEINNTLTAPKILAQLDGPMVGRAYKADFLNIGRQQRIVSTAAFLYVIDEDDNGLITVLTDPTPVEIRTIDRMNDSRESSARFVLVGTDQNLYVWERVHKKPFKLNTRSGLETVLTPVVSFPQRNTNQHVVTQRNGKIFMLNDRGDIAKGFPIDILYSLDGAFATTQNGATGETNIQGVNKQGEFFKIGPDGKILDRKQLILPEAGSNFKTLFDENSLDWLILRQTESKAAVLSKEGSEIFEIVNLKRGFSVKYHYFGSDNRFISVVSGGLLSIFDFSGNRIGNTPIPCSGALGMTFQSSTRELNIFSQSEQKIQIWSTKL